MKTIFKLLAVFESKVGSAVFQSLMDIYPQGLERHSFNCILPLDDPRVAAIQQTLKTAGFKPWEDHSRQPLSTEYSLSLDREYDENDLQYQPLLQIKPRDYYCSIYRSDADGALVLEGSEPYPTPDFAVAAVARYVIPVKTKLILESQDFKGITFRPTIISSEHRGDIHTEWWELRSNIEMPPLSVSMDLRDRNDRPISRDGSTINVLLKEGLYENPELRYDAVTLSDRPSFDLAHTFEIIGGDYRWKMAGALIASQRFYNFCVANELHSEWIPVRVVW